MARRKPWYKALFERDYYDYFLRGGSRALRSDEEEAERSDRQVDFIVEALELPERASVLDLCCGWGRHAVRLAQRDFRVTGLDLSAYHLRLAKAAARKAGVAPSWVRADMREIPPRRRFDAVINCFTSFGYFETQEEDQQVLDGIRRALKPGGRFLIDTMNHDWLVRGFRDSDWQELPSGALSLERRRYDIHAGRVNVDWIFITPEGERVQQYHSVRLYTFPEFAAMLSTAGLTMRETWGGLDGREFSMHNPRMVVLAERT